MRAGDPGDKMDIIRIIVKVFVCSNGFSLRTKHNKRSILVAIAARITSVMKDLSISHCMTCQLELETNFVHLVCAPGL